MVINIDLDYDQCDKVTLETLLDYLKTDPSMPKALQEHFHYVIAYMSVPGQYEKGKYDDLIE
jgi:hypothetical protein